MLFICHFLVATAPTSDVSAFQNETAVQLAVALCVIIDYIMYLTWIRNESWGLLATDNRRRRWWYGIVGEVVGEGASQNFSLPRHVADEIDGNEVGWRGGGGLLLSYVALLLYVLLGKAVNLPGKFYKLSRKVLRSPVSINRRLVVCLLLEIEICNM